MDELKLIPDEDMIFLGEQAADAHGYFRAGNCTEYSAIAKAQAKLTCKQIVQMFDTEGQPIYDEHGLGKQPPIAFALSVRIIESLRKLSE